MRKWIGVLLLFLHLGGSFAAGEENASQALKRKVFPEEDAETIFATNLGDAETDLFLQGSWETSVTGSLGMSVVPGSGFNRNFTFPGFTDGLVFQQKPDLTLSLWLMKRYYFETTYGENYKMNTYLLGYQGREGDFVQSIKIGNKEIEISPFPYMDFPGSARSSPGIAALFQTSRSQHEFFLRYDPSQPQKKTFVGKNEVNELRTSPQYYVRGKFFVLPDATVDFVTIYLESADGTVTGGDGRKYKKASGAEAAFSLSSGTVTLAKPWAGRVLVYYEKGGKAVGSSSLGAKALPAYVQRTASSPVELDPRGTAEDFSWTRGAYMGKPITRYQVTIGGNAGLLLYDPGTFTPFEIQGVYSLEGVSIKDSDASSIKIVRKGTSSVYSVKNDLLLALDGNNAYVRVVLESDQVRSMLSRYPFADDLPRLYGPDLLSDGGGADFELLARAYTPVQSFVLTNDVIPGSVRIYRNGKAEDLFSVDYTSGIVSFSFEVTASDTIEIYFRTYSGEGEGGDILFGTGNTIQLRDDLILKLAGGVRWNILKGSYSTEPDDHPGVIGTSAQIAYKGENLKLTADGAVIYSNPDTSGLLRLLGMEKAEIALEISKNNMFPSSIPSSDFFSGALTSSNRGKLYFKNYESEDLVGNTSVNNYTWTPPSSQLFSYTDGSKPGPYVAAASSDGFSRVLVMDYELSSSQQWVGAQMNLSVGTSGSLNFSKISAIRFAYKIVAFSGAAMSLHLQTGAVSEDLDGDGILDEESGPSSRGYAFNDGVLTLYVGGGQKGLGNDIKDSEDANGNGILEQENSDLVFPGPTETSSFNYPVTETGTWKTGLFRIPAADANRLAKVRAVRIVLKKEGSGTASGKVLFGKIVFEGSDMAAQTSGSGSLRLREIVEPLADEAAGASLAKTYPDILDTFHSSGSDQKILETTWKDFATTDTWELKTFTVEVPAENYQGLNFFIRTAKLGTSPAKLTLSYTDAEGKGLKLTFPITATNTWQKLAVNLPKKRATLGGEELPTPTVDSSYGKLTRFSLVQEGSSSGTLYLDELYLSDPAAAVGFAGSITVNYSAPGTNLAVGSLPVLQNFAMTQRIAGQSKTFQTQVEKNSEDTTTAGYFYSSTNASGNLFSLLSTEGEFSVNVLDTRIEYEGGHVLRFPANGGPVVVKEQFKRSFHALESSMSRANGLDVNVLQGLSWNSSADAVFADEVLTQKWSTAVDLSLPALPFLKLQASLKNSASGYVLEDASYGKAWSSAYSLLTPWTEGTETERQGLFSLSAGKIAEPVGFTLSPELSYVNNAATSKKQRNREKIDVEVPLTFRSDEADPGWKISLLYGREGNTKTAATEAGSFPSDLWILGRSTEEQKYFYQSAPFIEIFAPSSWTRFEEDTLGLYTAEYVPRFEILYSRVYGSNLADLFLPSRVEIEFRKTLNRDDDALSAKNSYDFKLTNFALNLFGTDGSHPLFPWYQSDEFQLQNSATIEKMEDEAAVNWSYTNQVTLSLYGHRDNEFILDHAITLKEEDKYTYQGKGTLKYIWKQPMIRPVTSEFWLQLLEEKRYYTHTEKFEVNYDNKDGLETYFVLGHETALNLKKKGFLKAGVNLGLGMEKDNSGLWPYYKILLGLEATISAHLVF